jgi:hypothetical protein
MPLYRTDEFGPNASDTLSRALANQMLPTPTAADGTKMSSNPETSARRMQKGNQASLTDIVQTEMLPPGYLLPTPVAHDATENIIGPANHRPNDEDTLARALHHLLPTPLLKTPVASENGRLDTPERYLNRNDSGGRFDLSDQVAALLPTRLASDYKQAGFQPSLQDPERSESISVAIMNLLPTPRAQNGETRNQNIYARPLDQPQNLENALALLPTPLTRPSKNGQIWVRPEDEFQNLENAIAHMPSVNALLPTPTVMDMGSNYTPEEWEAWKLKQKETHSNGNGHGASLTQEALLIGASIQAPLFDGSECLDDQPLIQLSPE